MLIQTKRARFSQSALVTAVLGALLLLAVLAAIGRATEEPGTRSDFGNYVTVDFGETTLMLEVASTTAARARGLGGRTSLSDGTGMLFVFDEPGTHGFWMRDMRFAIDIVWLRSRATASGTNGDALEVVHVASHVLPESFPTVFYPDVPADHVIEVAAGAAEALGLVEGAAVTLR